MKILITGATGFLGSNVLEILGDKFGKEIVLGTGRNIENGSKLRLKGFSVITGDLTDKDFVKNELQGFSHIIHCAAKSSLWGSYDSFYNNNVQITKNLLDLLPGVRMFVYISTPSIYFKFQDQFNINEKSSLPRKFVNDYAATKYLAEQEVLQHSAQNLIKVVLRPRALVGAGDTVIVPRIIRAFESGRLRIIGDGNNLCDFTSVKNMAHAICLSIEAGDNIDGKILNITDDEHKYLWQVAKYTLDKLGYNPALKKISFHLVFAIASVSEVIHKIFNLGEPVLTRYGVGLLRYSQTFDISEAKKILKYKPVITTEESIDEYINSKRDAG